MKYSKWGCASNEPHELVVDNWESAINYLDVNTPRYIYTKETKATHDMRLLKRKILEKILIVSQYPSSVHKTIKQIRQKKWIDLLMDIKSICIYIANKPIDITPKNMEEIINIYIEYLKYQLYLNVDQPFLNNNDINMQRYLARLDKVIPITKQKIESPNYALLQEVYFKNLEINMQDMPKFVDTFNKSRNIDELEHQIDNIIFNYVSDVYFTGIAKSSPIEYCTSVSIPLMDKQLVGRCIGINYILRTVKPFVTKEFINCIADSNIQEYIELLKQALETRTDYHTFQQYLDTPYVLIAFAIIYGNLIHPDQKYLPPFFTRSEYIISENHVLEGMIDMMREHKDLNRSKYIIINGKNMDTRIYV
uniref:Uncharacterized protein n=1 Tax=Megaviridae environmental sample TaxID=1737588 RepID=A0A5J6VH28_9VIRU|nr:MAG: hypothetical protein [Megaviridae environmental sample]